MGSSLRWRASGSRTDDPCGSRRGVCKHGTVTAASPSPRSPLVDRTPDQVADFLDQQRASYDELTRRGLELDLTRGKPSSAQLDLSDALLDLPRTAYDASGVDTRNYGGLAGIAELRAMFADLLRVEPEQVVAGGNSSLVLMREVLTDLWLKGAVDGERPWGAEEKVTFVCPVPGYDRHFTLLHWLGIETVTVPMHRGRPGRRGRGPAGGRRPDGQGHLDRADLRQPDRLGGHPGDRRAARLDADGGPGLQDLLGQRLRLPPPHRGRGEERRRPLPVLRGGPPAPPGDVRLDLEDHLRRRRAWRSWPGRSRR